jgi:hypothetical protein
MKTNGTLINNPSLSWTNKKIKQLSKFDPEKTKINQYQTTENVTSKN